MTHDFSNAVESFRTEIRRRFRRRRSYRSRHPLVETGKQEETNAKPSQTDAAEVSAKPQLEAAPQPIVTNEKPRHLADTKPPAAVPPSVIDTPKPAPAPQPVPSTPEYTPQPPVPAPVIVGWSEAEVLAGLNECLREVSGKRIVFEAMKPIKDGACGLPAPILLKAFEMEKGPALAINPAPTTSCGMASALRRWIDEVVQPEAKRRLDAVIVTFTNASAYQCRNQYNSPHRRLSEHATGNALDVATFKTAKGEVVSVADHWNAKDGKGEFLHAIHDGACAIFGTTLGPEANEDHRNHFHLDMTPRRKGICDFTSEQIATRERAKQQRLLAMSKQLAIRRIQFGFAKRPSPMKRFTSR